METALQYWNDELEGKSEATRREYRRWFRRFLEFAGWTPEELYEIHKKALKADDPRESRVVARKLRSFLLHLDDGDYSESSKAQAVKALKSFLSANELELKLRDGDRPSRRVNGQHRITQDLILEVYRYCQRDFKLRNRALTMILKDSGLRCSDLSVMDAMHYLEAREVKVNGERFKVFRPFKTVKTGEYAHVRLGPESIEAIDLYLDGREGGPLFIDRYGKRMKPVAISMQFQRLCKHALGDASYKVSAHSFRKFFQTRLESVMPQPWVLKLMGKATSVYSQPTEDELTDAYVKSYDAIRIFGTGATSDEVEDLRQQVRDLQVRMNDYVAMLRMLYEEPQLLKKLKEQSKEAKET